MSIPSNLLQKKCPNQVPQDQLMQRCQDLFEHPCAHQLQTMASSTSRARLPLKALLICSLYFVVSRLDSFSQVYGTLRRSGIWNLAPIRVAKQAFFKRFQFFNPDLFLSFINLLYPYFAAFGQRSASTHPAAQVASFANDIYALDDCLPDQVKRKAFVRERLDNCKVTQNSLPGRFATLFNVCTGLIFHCSFYDDPFEHESQHAIKCVEHLPAGCLLLTDLGFFKFAFFDALTERFTYFLSRIREHLTYEVIHTYVSTNLLRDRLVYLGKNRSNRAAYPVRLVEFYADGKWWQYITNVLDPSMLRASEVYFLYGQRWSIERCFSVLKEVLGLRQLRLCSLEGVQWQLWATVLGFQVAQSFRLELAAQLGVSFERVSMQQFFVAHEAYYREAVGRSKKSFLAWLIQHHESFGILKSKRRAEKKLKQIPEDVRKQCGAVQYEVPEGLEVRKPRYGEHRKDEKTISVPPYRKVKFIVEVKNTRKVKKSNK